MSTLTKAVLLYESSIGQNSLELDVQEIWENEFRRLPLNERVGIYWNLTAKAATSTDSENFDFFTAAAKNFRKNFIIINGGNAYWRPVEGEVDFRHSKILVYTNENKRVA